MAEYTAELLWERGEQDFLHNRYSRKHLVQFDGGVEFAASASPHVVPMPWSDAAAVDPEEMLVAALSSCHMLSFLYIAVRQRFQVDRYFDAAVGVMEPDEAGRLAITRVTLNPQITFSGERLPSPSEIQQMHHQAHEECYIANSVKTEVTVSS
jgi:organic hydroperoxide reductase OsmC/OhrA